MRRHLTLLLLLAVGAGLRAAESGPDSVLVPPLKTSIYVGTVTLIPAVFERHGDTYTTTYEVQVWPWIFWGEKGRVTIHLTEAELARVRQGHQVEFRGEGFNHKNKPRKVTGRVQPADAESGKMKIRITADGYTLVFNGNYRFAGPATAGSSPVQFTLPSGK